MYYEDDGIKNLNFLVLHKRRLEVSMPHPVNV